ncbi:alpha/beta fold hydrolase [Sinisalibacter aestuarii]|uniref:Alpha/beta hydrolase n=1 Tax=Sinisalibacter aestuarii TaxID=2949426 RepID=A0ABQ5LWN2_9RHOB|nr:alpha/beta fold hydrolase [Sinisalibacter aestuarii]GKY89390.1 alpha/beta hydrolase [Sinisalibacter aestuarii]
MTGWVQNAAAGIEYLERPGTGPLLVLLHGIGSQAASFTPLLPYLAADARVIAWNAPGYAGSAPFDDDWPEASDYAAALLGLVEALDLGPFTLVGHSLGTLMGAAFAARNRDRVERLVLASPALGHGVPRGGGLSAAAQARIDDLQDLGPVDFAAARSARLVHAPEAHADVVALVREGMSKVSLPGYAQAARMLASGRLLDDAERLAVPTDVIVGAEDVVTPPDGARRALAAVPARHRGQLTILPDTGHAIYQQAPAGFAAALETQTETAG